MEMKNKYKPILLIFLVKIFLKLYIYIIFYSLFNIYKHQYFYYKLYNYFINISIAYKRFKN